MKRARAILAILLLVAVARGQYNCNNPPCDEPTPDPDPMAITFPPSIPPTVAYQWPGTTIVPAFPASVSGEVLLAFINVTADDGLTTPTCTAPDGTWTLIKDSGGFGIARYCAVWYKLGDGSTGNMTWTFSTSIRGEVAIATADEVPTSSPIDTSSFKNESSLTASHSSTSITTSQNNEMVVCVWFSVDTGINYLDSSDLPNTLISLAGTGASRAMQVSYATQAVAGASGAKTATSNSNSFTQMIMFGIKPAPNATTPSMTFPTTGAVLTEGASVTMTCSSPTSPTAAQSTLKVEFSYSTDGGTSWTALALSSAGVFSKALTVPSVVTNIARFRVRSNDPAAALYSLTYDTTGNCQITAEVAPPAPTINLPAAGEIDDKAVVVSISWTYGGGSGNPCTETTIQYSNDSFSSVLATDTVSGAGTSTTHDFSAQASGTTISMRIKTKGFSLYSAYSNVRQFIVASKPATPNITAPTAGSPPTTTLPTVTFTESDTFVARKFRVTLSGVEVYNTGELSSTALSFASPYNFHNGVAVAIFLSVKNSYGLWSAEDTETVTPSFTVPTAPTIVVTASNDGGYIQIQITNSGSLSYNLIRRYKSNDVASNAINITPHLPSGATYLDYNVESGVTYIYIASAWNSNGSADSSASSPIGVTLKRLFIHGVSRTNTAGNNNGNVAILTNPSPNSLALVKSQATVKLLGRSTPFGMSSPYKQRRLAENIVIPRVAATQFSNLQAIYDLAQSSQDAIVCVRDEIGNLIFAKITRFDPSEGISEWVIQFEAAETAYTEAI